jgi:hypothetical protein
MNIKPLMNDVKKLIAECIEGEVRHQRQATDHWQPIATAPRDGTMILLAWFDDDRVVIGCWRQFKTKSARSGWIGSSNSGAWGLVNGRDPSHWRALPEPPRLSRLLAVM